MRPELDWLEKLPELRGGHGNVRTSELRVVGDVQEIDRRFQGEPLIEPEIPQNPGIPVAHRVVPQAVDVLRKNTRTVSVGLTRRAAFEAHEAGRQSGVSGPNRGSIVPHVDVLRVDVVVVQRRRHLVHDTVVGLVAPTDQS